MSKVYFTETQYFDQIWMKLLMILVSAGVLIPLLIACYQQLVLDVPWGQDAPSNFTLLYITLAMIIVVAGVNVMIFTSKLETRITSSGIEYRYRPFIYNWKQVPPEALNSMDIRRYNAWKEFGGYGFKMRIIGGRRKALIMKGNQGLQLLFKNGKKLLIGTQRPQEMKLAIQRLSAKDPHYG